MEELFGRGSRRPSRGAGEREEKGVAKGVWQEKGGCNRDRGEDKEKGEQIRKKRYFLRKDFFLKRRRETRELSFERKERKGY